MSEDNQSPPDANTHWPQPNQGTTAKEPTPIAELYRLYLSHKRESDYLDIFVDKNSNIFGFTYYCSNNELDIRAKFCEYQRGRSDNSHYYLSRMDLSLPFEEALYHMDTDVRDFKTMTELKNFLVRKQYLEDILELELDYTQPVISAETRPNLETTGKSLEEVFWRKSKRSRITLERVKKTNISAVYDGSRSAKDSSIKLTNLYIKIASNDGVLKPQYKNFNGIPRDLQQTAAAYEEFLKSNKKIFVTYIHKSDWQLIHKSYFGPATANQDIERTQSSGVWQAILVLGNGTSFQEHIRGKYVSLHRATERPIIAMDKLRPTDKELEWLNRPAPDFYR